MLLVILCLFSISSATPTAPPPSSSVVPIVFVGGLGGQALDCRLDKSREPHPWCFKNRNWFRLWMNVVEEIPHLSLECFYHNIPNFFEEDSRTFHNNPGVEIRGTDYGGVGSVEYLCPYLKGKSAYMHKWIEYFVKNAGYERGKTFRAAPFDWRLGPVEFALEGASFDHMKELIEETFGMNGNSQVRLIGHSLGSPYLSYFLATHVSQDWKDKFIDSFVSISGPYDGAYKAVREAITGDTFQQPMKDTPEWLAITRTVAGVFWMSPTVSASPLSDVPFIETSTRSYSLRQLKELFTDANATNAYAIYEHVSAGDKTLAPGVKTACIYGKDVDTPFGYRIPDLMNPNVGVEVLKNVSGDGVVDSGSLELCDTWSKVQKEEVMVWRVKDAEHTELVKMREVWDFVLHNVTRSDERGSHRRRM